MKRFFLGLLSFFLLVFSACGAKKDEPSHQAQGTIEDFECFLTKIQPQEIPWTEEELQTYESYLQPKEFEHIFSKEEIQNFTKRNGTPNTVTAQQAKEDVTTAFQLLSYAYSGYHYFGGDEVFLPIRDSILEELETTKKIKTHDLWKLLWESLSPIIVDRHFYITTDQSHTFKSKREYTQSAYFVRDLYFDDPTGVDSQYVKRTIGPDGALTYCLVAVCQNPAALPNTMTIEGNEHSLNWYPARPLSHSSFKTEKVFSETTVADGELPVLKNYALYGSDNKIKKFVATGTSYQEKPLFVLDLRGNVGGNDSHARSWLKNFCGKLVDEKRLLSTKLSNYQFVANGENGSSSVGQWRTSGWSDGTLWETDNLVFVLIDENTSSSGESFTNMLAMGKRAVLVGTNTMGCLNFGNVNQLYLPNSGIKLRFGTNFSFYQSLEQTDGIGYSPDLWVEPGDSLDAVVRLCNYYGLFELKGN